MSDPTLMPAPEAASPTSGPIAETAGPGADDMASPLAAVVRRIPFTTWVNWFLVGGSVLYVLCVVNPDGLLLTRSTPTG